MNMIPIQDRHKYRCHFCGETRSVKYVCEVMDPVVSTERSTVACCNKCAAIYCGIDNARREPEREKIN